MVQVYWYFIPCVNDWAHPRLEILEFPLGTGGLSGETAHHGKHFYVQEC